MDHAWGGGDGAAAAFAAGGPGMDDDDDDGPEDGGIALPGTTPATEAASAAPEPEERMPPPETSEPTTLKNQVVEEIQESQVVEEIQESQVMEETDAYPETDLFALNELDTEVPATQPEPESPAAVAAAKAEPMTYVVPSAGSPHSSVNLTDADGTKGEIEKKRAKILLIQSGVLKLSVLTSVSHNMYTHDFPLNTFHVGPKRSDTESVHKIKTIAGCSSKFISFIFPYYLIPEGPSWLVVKAYRVGNPVALASNFLW